MSTSGTRLPRLFKLKTRKPPARVLATPKTPTVPKPELPISIKDLANEPNPDELAKKFKQRATQSLTFRDRQKIYDFTIGRLALAKRFSLVEDILESHKDFSEISHEGFTIRLIAPLYGKAGMFDQASKVFDEMPQLNCTRTVKSLNALMKAGVESKKFDEVRKIFREIPSGLSIDLNCVSYNTIVHCLCEMGLLDDALSLLEEMKEKGLSLNVITFNTILDGFYRVKVLRVGRGFGI